MSSERREPSLRQGNSDRRAPKAVKAYAKANPHRMGAWKKESKRMSPQWRGDFRSNEVYHHFYRRCRPSSHRVCEWLGVATVLKDDLSLTDGEVIDATKMSVTALAFLKEQIAEAKIREYYFRYISRRL